MTETINALKNHNTIFLSAQPDETYFHWQVEIYLYQFAKHGIQDRCYALLGYRDAPSDYALGLQKKYPHVLLYKDDRDKTAPDFYIPTIRPHLLAKFFAEFPELGASVFYHDSDIFLVRLPRFELMLADNADYVSDTINYIGYNYINDCQKRYTAKHPAAADDLLIKRMCDCVGVSVDLVRSNEKCSGGAQYLMKGVDVAFWKEAEILCQSLYDCMKSYDKQYPIKDGIQIWTSDMWIVLWLLWKRCKTTVVHTDLDFSWGISTATEYFKKPIFHLAGVTPENSKGKFYKGAYHSKNVFKEYARDKTIFDAIVSSSATYEYVRVLKEYAQGYSVVEQSRFLLDSKDAWSSVYQKEKTATVFGRPIWRSVDGNYFIFHNGSVWILTHKQYEEGLTKNTGGFASTKQDEPYDGGWNQPCKITVLDMTPDPHIIITDIIQPPRPPPASPPALPASPPPLPASPPPPPASPPVPSPSTRRGGGGRPRFPSMK